MQAKAGLPEDGFVRLPQVLSVYPVSRSTWWDGVRYGVYPKPVKLGSNTTVWRVQEIRALIDTDPSIIAERKHAAREAAKAARAARQAVSA